MAQGQPVMVDAAAADAVPARRLCEENPHNFTGLDLETVVQGTTTEEQTVHTALDGAYLDGSYYELQRGTERAARLDWGAPAEDVQDALNTLTLTDARVDIIPVGVNPSFQPDYIIRSAQASRDRFVDPGTLLRGLGAAGAGNVATLAVVDIGNRGAAHHALLGSYDGYTYPPGAGNLDSITYDTSSLQGTTPAVVNEVLRTGSTPFSGTFSVAFNGAKTEEMEWQEAADEVEYVIEKLDTIGEIRVDRTDMGLQRIPGVTATSASTARSPTTTRMSPPSSARPTTTSKSPGKNDKSFYFVENVHTDDPVFVDDAAFVVSPDLFSSSLGDVVPIVERDGAASVVDDGEDYRTYLVGLGRAFDVVVVRLDADGRYPEAFAVLADALRVPERALTYVACEDLRRRRSTTAPRRPRCAAAAAPRSARPWRRGRGGDDDDDAAEAPKEAEAPVSALFEKLPPTPTPSATPRRRAAADDLRQQEQLPARPFGDNHDEYVVAEIIFAATAEQAPLAPYRCNVSPPRSTTPSALDLLVDLRRLRGRLELEHERLPPLLVACSILDGNQPGGSTKLER
ncbi:hypothetical protein JL721_10735 [Aureococcus anophagefferens]|nr:hypothetical protein JL721_10735 [Aureococcus anophagefferens]